MPIGKIEAFDAANKEWGTYCERVEQYFLANEIEDDKQVPAILSLMGSKTYGLLRSLCSPAKPSQKTFTEIVKILQEHLSPKPLVIAERFRFHKRSQLEGESISSFLASLKKLSEYCEFGTNLNDSLRDRFVCGLSNELIQKRLLSEADLSLSKASEIALAMETAAKDSQELQGKPESTEVNKLHPDKNKTEQVTQQKCPEKPKTPCYRCGAESHNSSECRFKNENCRKCGKRGHIQRVCRSSRADPKIKRKQNYFCEDDDDNFVASVEINKVNKLNSSIIWVTTKIDGHAMKMELDTGSAVSIIPLQKYKQMFRR
jgi:hypothetical protein